jgi:predicted PurR-regulated permease PerM
MDVLDEVLPARTPASVSRSLIAIGILLVLLYYGQLFFVTLISSVVIAFILEPVVAMFMRMKLPRGPASFLACSLALLGLYFISLGAYTQVSGLMRELPTYSLRLRQLAGVATERVEQWEESINNILPRRMQERGATPETSPPAPKGRKKKADPPAPPPVQEVRIQQEKPSVIERAYESLSSIYDVLLAASFVPFLVYFMLSWRDHIRRSFLQIFKGPDRSEVAESLRGIAELTRAYIAGNFVLGIILSVVTTLLFLFLRLPYALLVGPVSGFLSLLPYIGLPLAVLPPVLAALPVYERLPQYLILSTAIAFLHLIALNLLYPKIVGGRVHLNPLAVTVALMFWGMLWGGAGLALAIPITAGIKAVCDNVSGLEPYGRLLGD